MIKDKIALIVKNIKRKINKIYYEHKEKSYRGRLKYLYYPYKKSHDLLIVFSAFSDNDRPTYNYTRLLKGIKCNRLYILDDFGYNNNGSFYLGEYGDYYIPTLVISLINDIKTKDKIKTVITLGSSKGGTAAIYYGLRLGVDKVIVGAPQYRIGNYLNTSDHKLIMEGIVGNITDEKISCLNNLLYKLIDNTTNPRIQFYIHCSRNEHTYNNHVEQFIKDLNTKDFFVDLDIDYYIYHSQVSIYFPKYFRKVLLKYFSKN